MLAVCCSVRNRLLFSLSRNSLPPPLLSSSPENVRRSTKSLKSNPIQAFNRNPASEIMLRLCLRPQSRRHLRFTNHRLLTSSTSSGNSPNELPTHQHQRLSPPPSSILPQPFPSALSPPDAPLSLVRKSVLALSATLLAGVIASAAVTQSEERDSPEDHSTSPLYSAVEGSLHKSNDSLKRVYRHLKQTGAAASVLWQSLRSVLSSANHEVRAGFELRVAALLADISAANANRRLAIVGAGGGAVVDWLLETVASPRDGCRTQAESARALAYLIADPGVCEVVLGRPHAVPNLLRFIFSCQPQRSKKQTRRSSFDLSDSLKGRSMLVAAIMDIVTSNCNFLDTASFKPILPKNANMRDIAAAIQVIEEGGLHMDPQNDEDDDNGDKGLKGIGIKIIEGTTVLGLARTNGSGGDGPDHGGLRDAPRNVLFQNKYSNSLPQSTGSSAVVPGLWDDLHYEHVAVPFAAWALANWAIASEVNRSHIQELDEDGNAIMTALMAPERSVKWHGSLVARLLLEDRNLPLNDSVPDWSSCLLSTGSQATKNDDIPLAQAALSAFLVSVERSPNAQKIVMEKGLHLLRDMAKDTTKHIEVQEVLVKAVELLFTRDMHLSLDESQRWSGILLRWVSGGTSCDTVRSSAMTILSRILENHGPLSVPISQAWLAVLLSEIVGSNKKSSAKGSAQPRNDKVKVQIDQSNMQSAGQIANQLASAVVTLARNQVGAAAESVDTFPLADLLSLEPFVLPLKNLKKDSHPKINAADSALATLKAVKALSGVCIQDSSTQEKLTQLGILCLLRRFLLRDDYEKLAATEAYDASRAPEAQERAANNSPESSSTTSSSDTSSLRVTPTAHMRRHAARLLTIISLLPEVQKVIQEDGAWCKWLEDCARGEVPGCSDLKLQSYARATLLNISCNDQISTDTKSGHASGGDICPRYGDALFLINPELPHWNCITRNNSSSDDSINDSLERAPNGETSGTYLDVSHQSVELSSPSLDVVFVHGLRGGPFKTWRISEDKSSTKSGLVEKIDQEAGKQGTFWPGEWLSNDFPEARMFSIKYKTNLTQWSGASLPLQEVSSMLLQKLVAAGIGNRPVVFVTHSMGGLVVKQLLFKAKSENIDNLVNNTVGVVFYSCPHFGSRLADMPWRMGLVLRPAPTIGELRSGSPRLVELNDFIHQFHKKGMLDVLSFCETKVTPIVEGYGGWAFRMEIVPIESAYPGFGELVVLESTDHINSCKPLSRTDPSYTETLEFLRKLKSHYT